MKTCSTCHLVYEDRFVFCTRDGTILKTTKPDGAVGRKSESNLSSINNSNISGNRLKVMQCPACGVEYPMTFTVCPSDRMPLREKKPRPSLAVAQSAPVALFEKAGDTIDQEVVVEPAIVIQDEMLDFAPPVSEVRMDLPEPPGTEVEESHTVIEEIFSASDEYDDKPHSIETQNRAAEPVSLEDYYSERTSGYVTSPLGRNNADSASLHLAAKAIVIGLIVITSIALYLVYNAGSRKPVSSPTVNQETIADQSPVFIPTPPEARNYVEETPEIAQSENTETDDSEKSNSNDGIADDQRATRRPSPGQPSFQQSEPVTKSEVREPREVDTGPVISHSTGGRINSRIVRVRSNRMGSGVRYDLTFALDEQTGRAIKWNRILISTRSARGINQSQTIPFYHRQGAAGSLTFTVSVEMKGATAADWKGKVTCTTLGTDERGRAVEAQFGAAVTP